MCLEPHAHIGQFGQEEIMQEIDVQRADADVLQCAAQSCVLGEPRLVAAKERHNHHHQRIHRQRARQIGPLQPQVVPFQIVGSAHEGHDHQQREEPFAVQETLHLCPIAMDEISQEEEVHVARQLRDARPLPEIMLIPREPRRHVQRGIGEEGEEPEADE